MPYIRCSSCQITTYSPVSARAEPACPSCGGPVEVFEAGDLQEEVRQRLHDAQDEVTEASGSPQVGRGTRTADARKELRRVDGAVPQAESEGP